MVEAKFRNHIVGRISGVTATDSKIEGAEKALAVMRSAGFSQKAIKKAERMIADAKARGVK